MTAHSRLPPPPLPARDWALFLDVDGTLIDLAPTPDSVHVPPDLLDHLRSLHDALDGALALVSGRRIETLETLFAPLKLPAIGLHGLQRSSGEHYATSELHQDFAAVDAAALDLAAKFPGSVVEHKGITYALHWRNAPLAEEPFVELAHWALTLLPGYGLQRGHDVIELRPDGHDKGDAVIALLQQPPFRGRTPVFVGDDLTDEHGFDAVNASQGLSVLVGERSPSAATRGLHGPAAVREWLRQGALSLSGEAMA